MKVVKLHTVYYDNPTQCQVNELTQQLNQQADYCASMGYACCSLLWRVSQQEQAVEAMLTKVTHIQPHVIPHST